MLVEHIEGKWIAAFVRTLRMCRIGSGDVVAILSETQSREVLVQLAELALCQIGARAFHIRIPSPPLRDPVATRSTGSSHTIGQLEPVIGALSQTHTVVDCTVEGLLHAPEMPRILAGGARVFMVSNEHPEILERLQPQRWLQPVVEHAKSKLRAASQMTVTSASGTNLVVNVRGAPVKGAAGYVEEPGQVAYWPGGLCLCFPGPGSVNGKLVLAEGDVNLTFKRYIQSPIELTIEDDHVVSISGKGLDTELLRSYYEAWGDRGAYGVSHVGWGLNPIARWDSLTMYDKSQTNGTELRAFAGNFLFSTGANEHAGRFTQGHFDFPMRHCTVSLDGEVVVDAGRVVGLEIPQELAE